MSYFAFMQKKPILIAIAAGAVVAMFLLARITGVIQFYTISTSSNMPTLAVGELIFSTNLKHIERNRFIFFQQYDSLMKKKAFWTHRCVGLPGDTLQMKNGVLYVNGKQGAVENKVWRLYTLYTGRPDYWVARFKDRFKEHDQQWLLPLDSLMQVPLTLLEAARMPSGLQAAESLAPADASGFTPYYFAGLQQSGWTVDNFGPLVVPAASYFVLGDYRHNAMDSRYIGLIHQSAVKGVAISDQ